uniref:Translationally-controlled tumor protein n=2 Tax=Canis lupus familiaris TaxID=9615 RepID=A0A8I3MP73_CANLF
MVSRREGNIDDSLICGNAFTYVISSIVIVMNHSLQETSFTKKAYKTYNKDDLKSVKGKLGALRPEKRKPFMMGRCSTTELPRHPYKFFISKIMNPDGMVALLDYHEDGVIPYMIFFKDGLEMETC